MKIPLIWQVGEFDTHHAVCNRIKLGRVWKARNGQFQIAIDLPLETYKPSKSHFDGLNEAKKTVETIIQMWFDQVDA